MFCPKCGTKNEDDARFCAACGAPLEDNTVQAPAAEQMTAPQAPESTQEAAQQPQMTAQQPQMTGQQPQMTAQQPQVQAPAAPKQPMSAKQRKSIITGAAVAALVIIFIIAGSVLSSPKRIAQNYFKASMEGQWEKAFKYMDLPKGDFITKELLAKTLEDRDAKDITNYEVVEDEDYDSKIAKKFYVTYYTKGNSRSVTSVELVRDGKFMLFWNRYKVSPRDIVSKNVKLTVRATSKLYIDDVEVPDKYIDNSEDDKKDNSKSSSEKTKKVYKIDVMFAGEHRIRVTDDIYRDIDKDYQFGSDEGYTYVITTTDIREDVLDARMAAAEQDLKTFFNAAIDNKSFDSVKGMCVDNAAKLKSIKSAYDKFVSNTYKNGYGVKSIDFNKFSTQSSSGTTDGCPYVKVSISAGVTGTGAQKSGQTKDFNETTSATFTYMYKDGQWKISAVTLYSIFY